MSISPARAPARKRPPTLFDDENGETCPPAPLFRHPVFRSLRPICYYGMPALVGAGLVLAQAPGAVGAVFLSLIFMALVVGVLTLSTWHGSASKLRDELRHVSRGHRFLCPGCLQFGPIRYACPDCEEEVEPFVIHTGGLYLNDCPHCHTQVFRFRRLRKYHELATYCARCPARLSPGVYHSRRVQVLGTLRETDLAALQQAAGSRRAEFLCIDDGEQLTYALNLSHPPGEDAVLLPSDAARAAEAVWLDLEGFEPLALGQVVDRYIRRAALTEGARRSRVIWVRQETVAPAVRKLLETRFGEVRWGVEPKAFLQEHGVPLLTGHGGTSRPAPVERFPADEDRTGGELILRTEG